MHINPCYINRHTCTNPNRTFEKLHKQCLYARNPVMLRNCMYVTKPDDERLCGSSECNNMSVEQRSSWRKKVRTINSKAKESKSPCYIYWDFIEIKPRARKMSQSSSTKPPEPVEEVISFLK